MYHKKREKFLQYNGEDCITWKKNPPAVSHKDGIWEHQMRSLRAISKSLIQTDRHSLDEESLQTLMTNVDHS